MRRWINQNRGFLIFLLCFGFFRSAMADWNPIPSGSMRPTLLEGDVVLVNRLAYDFKIPLTDIAVMKLGSPQRGDVVTFTSPVDGVRLIKRLVGVPGDVVEMRDEILFVNGSAAEYSTPRGVTEPMDHGRTAEGLRTTERIEGSERTVQFLPAIEAKRSFGPISVPADSYFFLGDNRDNSADSRYIGVVPRRLLIGRAHHILVSANIKGDWLPRLERVGERIQ
ncbi:signal peptidase I [Ideonella azotifigens]|uniref:signal peptidase I n=2 Tax=Ideonella azotifigens TaxID=513160 RepID=UPI0011420A14|nr:signal peptidase I [Ideonella azotifigens]MCD2342757.1 signal peptidase I [Ideonella azotifigens]